jgi:O-acetyl-ADP-ribose deacetylase (regulator of RNase III)
VKEFKIGEKRIQIARGNIVEQSDVEAIVNAANAMLAPGGGVAGAIHRVAGPELYQECRQYAPINPGEAVLTKGYRLPNKYVIHTLGPRYGIDKPEERLLNSCYENALKLADRKGIKSVAFPAISTGVFGYPVEDAAKVALTTIKEVLPSLASVELVRMVLFSEADYQIHLDVAEKLL